LDTIVNILRDDQGQVKTIVMCSRDISERKKAESQREAALDLLAKSEEKYRSFFENAIQGMYQSTVDGRYLNVNPAFARMHGFDTPEEMVNNVTDIATQIYKYPEERERLRKIIMEQGVLNNYEVERLRKDGQVIWQLLNVHLVRDNEGKIVMTEGTCIDITDRKRAEDALAKSEEQYRTITENMMDCIVLADAKGIFQYVINCQEILGYSAEEMIGKTGLSFCHPDERTREVNLYHGAIGKEWHEIIYETRIRHKSGHYVSIEINARTLIDAQGKVIGAVFAGRDAVHYRQMAKELFHTPKSSSTSPILSLREKEILGWVMQGKSTWDIATILDISERTVKFHIDSTMKKLSAVNRTHAVVIALRDELI
jgi:PAS domain S-box-containing protein